MASKTRYWQPEPTSETDDKITLGARLKEMEYRASLSCNVDWATYPHRTKKRLAPRDLMPIGTIPLMLPGDLVTYNAGGMKNKTLGLVLDVKMGDTHVLCTATIEDRVPPFIKGSGLGWVTAEYGMLPRATNTRMRREAAMGKQGGRTVEIQRLIGRALRAGVDRSALGERQITIDCDVLQADGGTRCASITGGWVALKLAVNKLMKAGDVVSDPLVDPVAAISCGIYAGQPVLDLDYPEDSEAGVDGNFIMTGSGKLIEIQMSAEGSTYSRDQMNQLMDLAEKGVAELVEKQKAATA